MGVLYDYFVADSDEQAASVVDRAGGPGSGAAPAVAAPLQRRGLFRRRVEPALPEQPSVGVEPVFPTVSVKGIDPVVQMGTLEALLTGRSYDEVDAERLDDGVLAVRDGGERLVVRLSASLSSALAAATDDQLVEVAGPWSQTEEFWGQGDPAELTEFLRALAALARQARQAKQNLYCWVCV